MRISVGLVLFLAAICFSWAANVSYITDTKIKNTGIKLAGPIIQQVTVGFEYSGGVWWNNDEKALIFVDNEKHSFNMFYPDIGKTYTIFIEELKGKNLVSAMPVKDGCNQYILTADKSLYLITLTGKQETMDYTFKYVMELIHAKDVIVSETRPDQKNNIVFGSRTGTADGGSGSGSSNGDGNGDGSSDNEEENINEWFNFDPNYEINEQFFEDQQGSGGSGSSGDQGGGSGSENEDESGGDGEGNSGGNSGGSGSQQGDSGSDSDDEGDSGSDSNDEGDSGSDSNDEEGDSDDSSGQQEQHGINKTEVIDWILSGNYSGKKPINKTGNVVIGWDDSGSHSDSQGIYVGFPGENIYIGNSNNDDDQEGDSGSDSDDEGNSGSDSDDEGESGSDSSDEEGDSGNDSDDSSGHQEQHGINKTEVLEWIMSGNYTGKKPINKTGNVVIGWDDSGSHSDSQGIYVGFPGENIYIGNSNNDDQGDSGSDSDDQDDSGNQQGTYYGGTFDNQQGDSGSDSDDQDDSGNQSGTYYGGTFDNQQGDSGYTTDNYEGNQDGGITIPFPGKPQGISLSGSLTPHGFPPKLTVGVGASIPVSEPDCDRTNCSTLTRNLVMFPRLPLYHVRIDSEATDIDINFKEVKGICFDNSYTKLYVGDSVKNVIYEYDYDEAKGVASNKRIIFVLRQFEKHGDISAIVMDTQNNLYIGLKKSQMLLVYDVKSKRIDKKIRLPTYYVTSLIFGSNNMDVLYAGTANYYPLASEALTDFATGDVLAISGTGSVGKIQPKPEVPDDIKKKECNK